MFASLDLRLGTGVVCRSSSATLWEKAMFYTMGAFMLRACWNPRAQRSVRRRPLDGEIRCDRRLDRHIRLSSAALAIVGRLNSFQPRNVSVSIAPDELGRGANTTRSSAT
jgi:hypothetical protein